MRPELIHPDSVMAIRVVAETAVEKVIQPVALELPPVILPVARDEDAPSAGRVAEALLRQRRAGLEPYAISQMGGRREALHPIHAAPGEQPMRTEAPDLIEDGIGARVTQEIRIRVARQHLCSLVGHSHELRPVLRRKAHRESRIHHRGDRARTRDRASAARRVS